MRDPLVLGLIFFCMLSMGALKILLRSDSLEEIVIIYITQIRAKDISEVQAYHKPGNSPLFHDLNKNLKEKI